MKFIILTLLVALPLLVFGQADSTQLTSDTTYWSKGGRIGATFNQATLTNWAAGGSSSVSWASYFGYTFDYKKDDVIFMNELDLGIGWIRQNNEAHKKSEDKLIINSSYGKKISRKNDKWFYNVDLNFRTQFLKGYDQEDLNNDAFISKFMAPGYLLISLGVDWRQSQYFNVSLNPISNKMTFVQDDSLSSIGAFGVDPGKKFRYELGASMLATFNRDIFTNVNYVSKLLLFTNYEKNPDKVDVNWENIFTMKINNVLSANIYNQLVYDYDIKFEVFDDSGTLIDTEERWQFKNIIGLGIAYNFGKARG